MTLIIRGRFILRGHFFIFLLFSSWDYNVLIVIVLGRGRLVRGRQVVVLWKERKKKEKLMHIMYRVLVKSANREKRGEIGRKYEEKYGEMKINKAK